VHFGCDFVPPALGRSVRPTSKNRNKVLFYLHQK
jgi:hypothetical protein